MNLILCDIEFFLKNFYSRLRISKSIIFRHTKIASFGFHIPHIIYPLYRNIFDGVREAIPHTKRVSSSSPIFFPPTKTFTRGGWRGRLGDEWIQFRIISALGIRTALTGVGGSFSPETAPYKKI